MTKHSRLLMPVYAAAFAMFAPKAMATLEFSKKEKKPCISCHMKGKPTEVNPLLTEFGEYYRRYYRSSIGCLDYDPKRVRLEGTIIKHDGLRPWWGLKLDEPLCTNAGRDEDRNIAYSGIRELHLVISADLHWEQVKSLLGTHAVLSGRLIPAFTGYHMTQVLLLLDEVHNAQVLKVPPRKQGDTKPPQTLPISYWAQVTVVQSPVNRVIKLAWTSDRSNPVRNPDDLVEHFFNGPMDIMWVYCRDGYTIVSAESSTNSAVFPMDGPGSKAWGLAVAPHGESAITITCRRITLR
jgi:hypothetical protein